jgi:hypothetical protein
VSVESFTTNLLIINGVAIEEPFIRPVSRSTAELCGADVLAIILSVPLAIAQCSIDTLQTTILIDCVIKCTTGNRLTTAVVLKTIPLVLFVDTIWLQRVKESCLFAHT